jgi:dienelactone hydrolase
MDASPEPRCLSKPQTIPGVWGMLEPSDYPAPNPGVILLTGSSGWKPAYAETARSLCHSGFTALAVDYLHDTSYESSLESRTKQWPVWQATVRNAVSLLQSDPSVSGGGIALVGYSLGAFLAVSLAASVPGVRAVVDFYGGGSNDDKTLADQVRGFPPLLILHGDSDRIVPVRHAHRLHDAVVTGGGIAEMHIYRGAGHGFNAPWSLNFSADLSTDSYCRMVAFLENTMMTRS